MYNASRVPKHPSQVPIQTHRCKPDYYYEPKGQKFGCTIFEDSPPIFYAQDSMDKDLINVLATETLEIKSLKQKDPYCKCRHNTLYMPSVKKSSPNNTTYFSKWCKM